jgi:hypothetical protein
MTPEQIETLNKFQSCGRYHPLTCGNNRGDESHRKYADEHGGDWGQLVATVDGWACPVCDYRQKFGNGIERLALQLAGTL